MEKILNIAIIGCGRVAGHHARSIQKITDKLKLTAVCDPVDTRREEVAKACNVHAYANYYEMLEKHPEIDVVGCLQRDVSGLREALKVARGEDGIAIRCGGLGYFRRTRARRR